MSRTPLGWMRARRLRLGALFGALFVWGSALELSAQPSKGPRVALARVSGAIDPGSGEYIVSAIKHAEQEGVEALVIELDTPGGLVSTTREIVKAIFESEVPVVVYVSPSAARAGSAGVFITLAAHVAAMAPATNIGAAHPVNLFGDNDSQSEEQAVLAKKLENDIAAFAESVAEERGRNVEFAVKAVRESESLSAQKALEQKVIDLLAEDLPMLLEAIDGRQVTVGVAKIERKLETRGAVVEEVPWSLRHRFLHLIGEPTLASILLSLGALGLLLEFYKPGALVPGVTGVILLVLGVIGVSALPVSAGGAVLLGIGLLLFVAEIFVTSYGLLGLAGALCFAAGGLLLIDPVGENFFADRDFGVKPSGFLPTAAFVAFCALFVGYKALSAWRMKPVTGARGLVGELGEAQSALEPGRAGHVFVHGELWRALSAEPIERGSPVRVLEVKGLTLRVEPQIEGTESTKTTSS